MTVENTSVNTINYLFLRSMHGTLDDENINEELSLFIYDLSNEMQTIKPSYVQEFKREINEGPYFEGLSRDEAQLKIDTFIQKIEGQVYPDVTQFYMGLIDFDDLDNDEINVEYTPVIVDLNIRTRVVVQHAPGENVMDDAHFAKLALAARTQIRDRIIADVDYPSLDSVSDIEYDDAPFNPDEDFYLRMPKLK